MRKRSKKDCIKGVSSSQRIAGLKEERELVLLLHQYLLLLLMCRHCYDEVIYVF